MSFQTFCGKDPADVATYNKVLEEFLPDTALGVVSVGVSAPLVNTGNAANPVVAVGFANAGDLIVGTGANAGAVLGIAGRAAGDYLRVNAGVNGIEWSAGAGAVPALSAVLAAGNDGNAAGITNAGVIAAADIQAPFGGIVSLNSTTIQDVGGTGLGILPVGTLHLKGCQTKGSILAGNGATSVEVPIGAAPNGFVLTADSAAATGVAWEENGKVSGITAGNNITIDNTAPLQPVVALSNPLTSGVNFANLALTGSSNDGVIDRSAQINIQTQSGNGGTLGVNFNEITTGRQGFTRLNQAVNVGELDVSFFDGTTNQSASSKFQAQLNQSSCRFETINSTSGDQTLREIAIIDGGMVDNTTGTNPTNNSTFARSYFTGGATISDTATYNITGGSASNVYQQTLNSSNSTLILSTTNTASPYTTSASLTSVKNGETALQLTGTDPVNDRSAVNTHRANAGTLEARSEIKAVQTGGSTSDMDLISDGTSCRIQQTYIQGGANNFSTITTNATGLEITSTNAVLTLTAGAAATLQGTTATLQSGSSAVVASSTAVLNSAAQILNNSTTAGAIANPSFIFRETNATATAFPTIKTEKLSVVPIAGNPISAITNWASDATGTQREWSRIQTKVENIGAGNQDGTLSIFNSVNGSVLETFNFNGAQNENNSFRPLDLNGNALRTASGDLTIDTSTSSGNGILTLATKNGTGGLVITGDKTQSATAGGSAGTHLVITLNGNVYKIQLLNP